MDYMDLLPAASAATLALARVAVTALYRRHRDRVAARTEAPPEERRPVEVVLVVVDRRRHTRRIPRSVVSRTFGQRAAGAATRNIRKQAPPSSEGPSISETAPPSMPTSPRV